MASNFKNSAGTDLDSVFKVNSSNAGAIGFKISDGTDLGNRYSNATPKLGQTVGYKNSAGTDLGNLRSNVNPVTSGNLTCRYGWYDENADYPDSSTSNVSVIIGGPNATGYNSPVPYIYKYGGGLYSSESSIGGVKIRVWGYTDSTSGSPRAIKASDITIYMGAKVSELKLGGIAYTYRSTSTKNNITSYVYTSSSSSTILSSSAVYSTGYTGSSDTTSLSVSFRK